MKSSFWVVFMARVVIALFSPREPLNRALALRVANLDYARSWLGDAAGRNFDHRLRFSTGVVLRVGTW